jgi:Peptidase C13 family
MRAAVWKTTPQPPSVGLLTLTICALIAASFGLLSQYIEAGANVRFSPYGLNSGLALSLLSFAIIAAFVRAQWRATVLSVLTLQSCVIYLLRTVIALARQQTAWGVTGQSFWTSNDTDTLFFLIELVWWLGIVVVIFGSIEPERRRALPRALVLYVVLLAGEFVLPYYPTFRGETFDIQTANAWEFISAYRDGRLNSHKEPPPRYVKGDDVDLSQAALLDAQISHLSRQVKGKTDVYAIGIAGSSEQDVFLKELKGGLASLAHVLPLEGHVVELVNHPDTVKSFPIASRQNFSAVVRAMARVMDKNEDVLLLFMTSHGSGGGVALSLPGAVYEGLSPANVATVLDREGIKNRVVIVSACYSGVFLKPLANENTIILTAADENNTSFGCSNEREWTYFGDAFFNQGLHHGGTIEQAFLDAKLSIAQWEARDRLTPSNPQGHFGPALMKKLAPLYPNSKNAMNSGAASPR